MQNYIKQQEDRFYKPLENKLQLGLITPEDADIESEKLFINLTKQLNNLHAFGAYKAQKIGDHYVWECLDVKPKSN